MYKRVFLKVVLNCYCVDWFEVLKVCFVEGDVVCGVIVEDGVEEVIFMIEDVGDVVVDC